MVVTLIPFWVEVGDDGTTGIFETDTAKGGVPPNVIDRDTFAITLQGVGDWTTGVINRIGIYLNPANAVTCDVEINRTATGRDYDVLFKSWDNECTDVADLAKGVEYWWTGLNIPFRLPQLYTRFYFLTDWSAAPGEVEGWIVLSGLREAT